MQLSVLLNSVIEVWDLMSVGFYKFFVPLHANNLGILQLRNGGFFPPPQVFFLLTLSYLVYWVEGK